MTNSVTVKLILNGAISVNRIRKSTQTTKKKNVAQIERVNHLNLIENENDNKKNVFNFNLISKIVDYIRIYNKK